MVRKGMMVGKGKKGYHNVIGKDPIVHSMSAKGIKQPQRVPEWHIRTSDISNSPDDLRNKNYGIYMTTTIPSRELDRYMQDTLDLTDHKDYEYVINQKLDGKPVGVLFLMSFKGQGRWETSLGKKGFSRTDIKELEKNNYELFEVKKKSIKKKSLIDFNPAIRKGQWSKISETQKSQYFQHRDFGLDIYSPDGENWKVTLNKSGMGLRTLYFGRNPTDAKIKAESYMKNTATSRLLDNWELDYHKGYVPRAEY